MVWFSFHLHAPVKYLDYKLPKRKLLANIVLYLAEVNAAKVDQDFCMSCIRTQVLLDEGLVNFEELELFR